MQTKRITVRSAAGDYSILYCEGLLRHAAAEVASLGKFSSVHLVSSKAVWRAVSKNLPPAWRKTNCPPLHLMDDAETAKNLRTIEKLSRSLVQSGADRKSLLVAVGGGVVGDVAGFVAASYLRGLALVQVPTTLIAQVDSSLGGKTGVNLPEGKNLVGAFYPPRLVLADPLVLQSLPARHYRGGLAEVIKYGIISDPKLFAFLESNLSRILNRRPRALRYIIPRSLEIKARVVSRDERESGLREILNFGHTFGHALESVTRYRTFQHGQAVAWGMMAAALLGHEIGVTPARDVSRIVSLVRSLGSLPPWPRASSEEMIALMHADKKAREGRLRFVLTPRIGKASCYDDVPLEAVERVLRFAPHFLDCSLNRHAR